ncbi:MAG: hypothetical protein LBB23_03865 [Rickettsiales bacterium]|jgi:hypothetical protein|nr:hypothetical protein [Rickettsiales bacterium]
MEQINYLNTLRDIRPHLDLCCWGANEATDLIQSAAAAAKFKMSGMSVDAVSVPAVWTWLEKSNIKLSAFIAWNADKTPIENLAADISAPLKRGADAVQIYVRFRDLQPLAAGLTQIKSEIFFDKKLTIALGLADVPPFGWEVVRECMDSLSANSLMLISKNSKNSSSLYYGFLSSLTGREDWGIEFCHAGNAVQPLEEVYRLTLKMADNMTGRLRFIVAKSFMDDNYKDASDETL